MTVRFHCDAPGCADRIRAGGVCAVTSAGEYDASSADARVTAIEIQGLRDRENPGDRPAVYLPPVGWAPPIVMKDGRRLYACSKTCAEEIVGREGRDPTGRRIGAACPACGQSIDDAWGDEREPRSRTT